ncbi:arsenate reductase ArsC [Candidatus Methylacidiphilum infernorum]|uniref:Arsenate reductase n=1 Tax=Methylacidiphilum infernorum (isolate V4) TaxID=481448 RepID=B3DWD3_METI4|nr:arsenate reductase ArsC [Candidatus Methylacidiphilum infernorum]ACD83636.1 Arsenate reductase [Methylacidiphilum infernorum V4]
MNNPIKVLFLCTANSARSIMAEAILRHYGKGKYLAFSAGSSPKGEVHPLALETLKNNGISCENLRSKSLREFLQNNSPSFDYVVTVCSNAAKEACPLYPKEASVVHWNIADPAAVEGEWSLRKQAFQLAFDELQKKIQSFFLDR